LKPAAKTSAPGLSLHHLSNLLPNKKHLKKIEIAVNFLFILLKKIQAILFRLFKRILSEAEEISG